MDDVALRSAGTWECLGPRQRARRERRPALCIASYRIVELYRLFVVKNLTSDRRLA